MLISGALTTTARLSSFMGITTPAASSADETSMHAIINAVTKFIEHYTGIVFKKTTYTSEEYSTERGQILNLKHFPIIGSVAIQRRNSALNESQWETLDTDLYSVDADAGIVMMMDGAYFYRTRNGYRATYQAGYDFDNTTTFLGDTDAADVEVAVWLIAQDVWNNKGSDNSIKSERIGDYSVTFAELSKIMFEHPQALDILNSYRGLSGGAGVDEIGVLTPLQSVDKALER